MGSSHCQRILSATLALRVMSNDVSTTLRSQAVLGTPPRPLMSAIWGNSENIFSLRVLPPVTQTGLTEISQSQTLKIISCRQGARAQIQVIVGSAQEPLASA